jgi:hypothetical protein
MIVRRVGVWSVSRMYGAMSAAFGLIAGLFLACFALIGAGVASQNPGVPSFAGPLFGVGAVIFLPIFYGVLGLVAGAIGGALYNVFAGMVGGIEIDVA